MLKQISGIRTLCLGILCMVITTSAAAASYQVANTADSGTGSLRQAVADANGTAANDMISFNIPMSDPNCNPSGVCTITLTSGEISIASSALGGELLILNSSGPTKLVISGNMSSRVLAVNSNTNFVLDGVTITRGNNGGLFNSNGNATIQNSIFTQNTGAYAIVSINTGTNTLNVINCSIDGNAGGINGNNQVTAGGRLNIIRSTISGNTGSDGGGVRFDGDVANIVNSTISGNTSPNGGGLFSIRGAFHITNTTITNNTATGALSPSGGGIAIYTSSIFLRNTILAGNISAAGTPDIYFHFSMAGVISLIDKSLIGNFTNTGQQNMGCSAPNVCGLPARLAPLGNYGGSTQTHALLPASPAINAGNNCVVTAGGCGAGDPSVAIPTDQRGFVRIGNVDIGAFERASRPAFDFDGDGTSDVSVFRPANGVWYLLNSSSGFTAAEFGLSNDKITPADYDGDGRTDIGVFRDGIWYLSRSSFGLAAVPFGIAADIPVPADYDGDGKAELAVYRGGVWYTFNLTTNQTQTVQFGTATDKPVAADYDGDGRADYAVYRPTDGSWYLLTSSLGFTAIQFGTGTDKPVVGDYDGDGKADPAVYRPSNGTWYLLRSALGFTATQFGIATDVPAPADYDGDNKTDLAVFRDGVWYQSRSTQGFFAVQFGATNDRPIPNAFVP